MVPGRMVASSLVTLACLWLPLHATAQHASGIAGVVRDVSGAVLPGVTVEAESPALIERVRVVFTDDQGRYNIVDLRPGSYAVTFTLPGFSVVRREGIVLPAGFTATVNADLQVGTVEETVTVTGAAPLVDTMSVRQQTSVSSDVLQNLPVGQVSLTTLAALTPGLNGAADVGGGSRGTFMGQSQLDTRYHGKTGSTVTYDGMRIQNFCSGGSPGYMFNQQTVQEIQLETGGISAETASTGFIMNMVSREGSNTFSFGASGLYTNDHLQSDNLSEALRARGLEVPQRILSIWDAGVTVGGPIVRDRLWFFGAYRRWGTTRQSAGIFWNATQGTPFYTPDLSRPAEPNEWNRSHAIRLTWQASPRNKVNVFTDIQRDHTQFGIATTITNAPEAQVGWNLWPTGILQTTWTSPVSNRLLLEAGAAAVIFHYPGFRQEGVSPDDVSILEQATNFRYNAPTNLNPERNVTDRFTQRFSVAYVTGSHTVKVGVSNEQGVVSARREGQGLPEAKGISYRLLNGVPVALDYDALPYEQTARGKAELGLFAQDQWAVNNRLTLNYGLRFDYVNNYVPAHHLAAGPFLPERRFDAVHNVPAWKDLSPRVGAVYDLFGDGRTAVKVSLGRYLDLTGGNFTQANNPVVTSVNAARRPWRDVDADFVPDCDLADFASNGECGPINNVNFGKLNPGATRYADDVTRGWHVRGYTWDIATEVQRQIGPAMSVTAGYYRNWTGNYLANDNVEVGPADFDPYCITAPIDPALPGGGGYEVCGLYDVRPEKFGQVTTVVTQASHFVDEGSDVTCGSALGSSNYMACGKSHFVALTLDARLANGARLAGGVDAGRTVEDRCFVVDSPQDLLHCRVVKPFASQTQFKLNGSYPLPGDFSVSGTYQNVPGPVILANYEVPSTAIAPSLGRPLAGGVRTATVPLIAPYTQWEDRRTQFDLRLTKRFGIGASARLQLNLDVYNVLNSNSVLGIITTYGSRWRRPTEILDGRLVQLGGNVTF